MNPRIAAVLLAAAAAAWWFNRPPAHAAAATTRQFRDAKNGLHGFSTTPASKPTLVVFWISDCGWCERSMRVMDRLRDRYDEKDLDMVGIYLNPNSAQAIEDEARRKGHVFPVVSGQDMWDWKGIKEMLDEFGFKGTGRSIYLVDAQGAIHEVDASVWEIGEGIIEGRATDLIASATGLRPQTPKPKFSEPAQQYSLERPQGG